MKRIFLLAAALASVAAIAACRSETSAPQVTHQAIPEGSTTVRAGMLHAKQQQEQQQEPLTNFKTRCRQVSGALRCDTN